MSELKMESVKVGQEPIRMLSADDLIAGAKTSATAEEKNAWKNLVYEFNKEFAAIVPNVGSTISQSELKTIDDRLEQLIFKYRGKKCILKMEYIKAITQAVVHSYAGSTDEPSSLKDRVETTVSIQVAVGCTPIDLWVNLHLLVHIKD